MYQTGQAMIFENMNFLQQKNWTSAKCRHRTKLSASDFSSTLEKFLDVFDIFYIILVGEIPGIGVGEGGNSPPLGIYSGKFENIWGKPETEYLFVFQRSN